MSPSTASQQPTVASNQTQSAVLEGLQPALRSTLSSLNINLDYELARYRYAKRGEPQPGAAPPQFRSRRKTSLELISVPQAASPARKGAMPPPPPPNPRLQRVASPPGMAEPTSEVAALRSAIVPHTAAPQATYMASSEALLQNFEGSAQFPDAAPMAAPTTRSWQETWLTPLGLGALLLLLVASAGLGFLLVNPSVASNLFQHTPLARFFPGEESDETATADSVEAEETATAELDGPPLTPLSPDLSQREFADLELNTLSNLPSSSAAIADEPETSREPANPSEEATGDRVARANRESVNSPQQVNQIPTTTTPAPQPAAPVYRQPAPAPTAAPAPRSAPAETPVQPAPPAAAPAPANGATSQAPQSSYYVVTDYTGDPSLDEARTAVGEAYVRNFDVGARIQMGAFNTPEGAAELTEQLRNQGIEAEVYEP